MNNKFDNLVRRCPKLGNEVKFQYCKNIADNNDICPIILNCWWEIFDVEKYLNEILTEEKLQKIKNFQQKPKMTSLIEMIEKAKRRLN